MHRSRIGVVLIDQPTESYDASAAFWGEVVGRARARDADASPGENPYETLGELDGEVKLELQRTGTGTPVRVHLDIETDDVEAEVQRVCALGAAIVEERQGYTILRDPGGLLFCVVPVQTSGFDTAAATWS